MPRPRSATAMIVLDLHATRQTGAPQQAPTPHTGSAGGLPVPVHEQEVKRLVRALGVPPVNFVVAEQLAAAIRDQWQRFNKTLRRCQRAFSEDAVHDARTSSRRLIARLTLVHAALGNPGTEPMLRSLKRLLKSLGELRDVQVQKSALTDGLRTNPEIAGLWMDLVHREEDLINAGADRVGRFKSDKLARQVSKLCTDLEDPVVQLAAKSTLRDATIRAVWEAFAEVLQRRRAIVASRPATVHRVRVAYKKFRYMVESLPAVLGTVSAGQLSAMADQQQAMGNIQDVEVRLGMVEAYRQDHPATAAGLARYRKALLERRGELIREFVTHADGLTSLWPACIPVPVPQPGEIRPWSPAHTPDQKPNASA